MIGGRPVLVSWTGNADRLAVVLAGPGYLGANWAVLLQGRQAQGALIDSDGKGPDRLVTTRTARGPCGWRPHTRLPGTLHATSPGPGSTPRACVGAAAGFCTELSGFWR